ncbi:hypothetical protein ACSTLB_09970 [Vibrio parahaemolyticus]
MTPESIVKNILEQIISFNAPSAMILVSGQRADVFIKTEQRTVPLFSLPSDKFFFATSLIFRENQFEQTKHFQFSPNNELRMVRFQSDRIKEASKGHDLIMTTSRVGQNSYQVLWYLNISHENLKKMEDGKKPFEDSVNQMFESDLINECSPGSGAGNYEQIVHEAEIAHDKYEEFISKYGFHILEYDGGSLFGVLSSGASFVEPYVTTFQLTSHTGNEPLVLKLNNTGIDFFPPYIFPIPAYVDFFGYRVNHV